MTTLLIAEHDNKVLKDLTAKALTAAKALGADVHVLVAGKDCKAVADAAANVAYSLALLLGFCGSHNISRTFKASVCKMVSVVTS